VNDTRPAKADWHWDNPLWPLLTIEPTEQGRALAAKCLRRRCAHCGWECSGVDGEIRMASHTNASHPGRPMLFTAYPLALAMRPMGGDA